MSTTTDRILTTHTGSLPRPKDLIGLLYAQDRGEPVDDADIAARVRIAVEDIVARQRSIGLDVVNDGEMGKVIYSTYVQHRLSGYTGTAERNVTVPLELRDFPDLTEQMFANRDKTMSRIATCEGPITYQDQAALQTDLTNLRDAVQALDPQTGQPAEVFVSSASPGIIATYLPNHYYATEEEYVSAIADAMKTEYDAIVAAGFTLQLDCPDLAFEYTKTQAAGKGLPEFRAMVTERVAALNHATRDIPADRMRMHICWGNGATPHHYDVPLADIVDLILAARPAGLSFEGANPRHAHEWKVWETTTLPEGKYLIPGVIDSTTNFIEHPELVAERVLRFASIVGPERVMAGVDCGLATAAGSTMVDREVAWRKLGSLVEGTRLANEHLASQGLQRAS